MKMKHTIFFPRTSVVGDTLNIGGVVYQCVETIKEKDYKPVVVELRFMTEEECSKYKDLSQ